MRILIATDAFPPVAGGSGWSTYELAKGLRARGHHVAVVRTYSERDAVPGEYDGFAVVGFPAFAPPVPFVRNYIRNERLYERLGSYLTDVIQDRTNRSGSRTTRADRPIVGDSGAARRHPGGLHRPRLLARVLLGRCAGGSWRRRSLSRLFRFGDDAVSAVRAPARHGRRRCRRFRTCGRISATNKPLSPMLLSSWLSAVT